MENLEWTNFYNFGKIVSLDLYLDKKQLTTFSDTLDGANADAFHSEILYDSFRKAITTCLQMLSH